MVVNTQPFCRKFTMQRLPFELRLYISPKSVHSERAVQVIQRICSERLEHRYSLEIIDVSIDKERAATDRILNVPTLVWVLPDGIKKLVGDGTNEQHILWFLDLEPSSIG